MIKQNVANSQTARARSINTIMTVGTIKVSVKKEEAQKGDSLAKFPSSFRFQANLVDFHCSLNVKTHENKEKVFVG